MVIVFDAIGGVPLVSTSDKTVIREIARAWLKNRVEHTFTEESLVGPGDRARKEVLELLAKDEGAENASPARVETSAPAWWPVIDYADKEDDQSAQS